MAFDETVAQRIRKLLARRKGISEKKMFGGLAFFVNGNMCCGVLGAELVVRLGAEGGEDALKEAHTRLMDFTGKPMRGFVIVSSEGFDSDEALKAWVDRGVRFARTLPAK